MNATQVKDEIQEIKLALEKIAERVLVVSVDFGRLQAHGQRMLAELQAERDELVAERDENARVRGKSDSERATGGRRRKS